MVCSRWVPRRWRVRRQRRNIADLLQRHHAETVLSLCSHALSQSDRVQRGSAQRDSPQHGRFYRFFECYCCITARVLYVIFLKTAAEQERRQIERLPRILQLDGRRLNTGAIGKLYEFVTHLNKRPMPTAISRRRKPPQSGVCQFQTRGRRCGSYQILGPFWGRRDGQGRRRFARQRLDAA